MYNILYLFWIFRIDLPHKIQPLTPFINHLPPTVSQSAFLPVSIHNKCIYSDFLIIMSVLTPDYQDNSTCERTGHLMVKRTEEDGLSSVQSGRQRECPDSQSARGWYIRTHQDEASWSVDGDDDRQWQAILSKVMCHVGAWWQCSCKKTAAFLNTCKLWHQMAFWRQNWQSSWILPQACAMEQGYWL